MRKRVLYEVLEPYENMKRDEENLLKVERGLKGRVFRVYKWSKFCISCGYSQRLELDGILVVKRPTGGGYLYHGTDISFSLVDLKENWGKNHREIYRKYTNLLLKLFKDLGIEAQVLERRGYSLLCYDYPSIGEITYQGKKLVCSAMRTLKRSFLIQSTVYVKLPKEEFKEKLVSLEDLGIKEEEFLKKLWEVGKGKY